MYGVAIDAPLIINNRHGQRPCERALSTVYRNKYAGCHPSNLSLYPSAFSVQLSNVLKQYGFQHIHGHTWQIECYPHPSIVECFGLPKRLAYKKGRVMDKRQGQVQLANYLLMLAYSPLLSLHIPPSLQFYMSKDYIMSLK